MAQVLVSALQQYLNGASPSSNTTSTIDLATPPEDTVSSDDSTTVVDDLIADAAALAGDAL